MGQNHLFRFRSKDRHNISIDSITALESSHFGRYKYLQKYYQDTADFGDKTKKDSTILPTYTSKVDSNPTADFADKSRESTAESYAHATNTPPTSPVSSRASLCFSQGAPKPRPVHPASLHKSLLEELGFPAMVTWNRQHGTVHRAFQKFVSRSCDFYAYFFMHEKVSSLLFVAPPRPNLRRWDKGSTDIEDMSTPEDCSTSSPTTSTVALFYARGTEPAKLVRSGVNVSACLLLLISLNQQTRFKFCP